MLDLRDRFVTPPSPAAELRAFTHGLMPRTVPALMAGFCEDWAERGVDAWNRVPDRWGLGHDTGWWSMPEDLADAYVAPMLAAPAGTCVLQPNVHWTVQALLSCDGPFEGRDEVVMTEGEFPSVRHSVQRWAGLRDLRPVDVSANADWAVDLDAIADAITDRTAWVIVSHVGFATGEVIPDADLRRLADAAHARGALLAVDGYHATASLPQDVEAIGADVYFGGLLKEACGSSGNAYLYVRPGLDLRPRLAGWFADAEPFAFAPAPADHPEVRRRFLGGTTAVASMYHAVEGLRILLDVGIDAVRADTLAKGARGIERADALGLPLRSPREAARRGAMVVFEIDAADRLVRWLKTQDVYVDARRGRLLRFSPFVWNPVEDVDRLFDAVEEALATGAHRELPEIDEGGPVT
ncbi:aminotransferase class V-fold PLP-dependent enzyme [Rubrivirga marina]|uniref:aminotransferase class V-fold PLP-dependent enzyme n=1 Tax=Rubrivirga marina TaxID=1196024 RepID=UPI001C527D41|nr:aminotransferase class V-fold PLP-dependent enzyme [Rubrivirga marina]